MGVFTAETIYDHMRREHEGIYDVAPQWANQPGPNNVHALVVDDRFVAAQEAELERLELRRAQRLATPRERVEEAVRENLRRRRQEMERHIVAQEEVLEAQRG